LRFFFFFNFRHIFCFTCCQQYTVRSIAGDFVSCCFFFFYCWYFVTNQWDVQACLLLFRLCDVFLCSEMCILFLCLFHVCLVFFYNFYFHSDDTPCISSCVVSLLWTYFSCVHDCLHLMLDQEICARENPALYSVISE
jgi:hypothetical protein